MSSYCKFPFLKFLAVPDEIELAEIGLPMVAIGATMTGAGKVIEKSGGVVQKATNMGINIYKATKKKNKYKSKSVTDEHLPHLEYDHKALPLLA